MRSALPAALTAALVSVGCAPARDVPPVAVSTPAPPPVAPEAPAPAPRPAPKAVETCTGPGASFRDPKRAPRELTPVQEKQIAEAEVYVRDHPGPSDPRGKAELAENKYARARALFEANRFAEAAVAFRDVAVSHADTDVGVYASQLYLESINVLGSQAEPARPICYDDMERDLPIFLDLYCTGAAAKRNAEQCTLLRRIDRDIHRLYAQKLVERAERGEGDAAAGFEQAGVAYLALARRCVDEARAGGVSPAQERCDELAYNAGRAFLAARQPGRAGEAVKLLLDPRNGMAKSPLAARLARDVPTAP